MQKGKKGSTSEPTTGASAIGLKTGDKVPYAEMGYGKPKPKAASRPSTSEPTTGASAIGLKTGDRVPRELLNKKPASFSKILGISGIKRK